MKEKYTIPWGPIRSMLSELSFSDIKYIIGFTNIDMTKLSHLEQKSSGGATKDQLLNAIGRELNSLNEQFQKKAIVVCCEEILAKHPEWEERLLQALSRVGWKFANGILLPIEILDYEDIINIKDEAHKDIMKAAVKFRDGDFSGSISSSCSAIDSVVTLIYQNNNSDPKGESFQKKILQSFKFIGFKNKIKSELSDCSLY